MIDNGTRSKGRLSRPYQGLLEAFPAFREHGNQRVRRWLLGAATNRNQDAKKKEEMWVWHRWRWYCEGTETENASVEISGEDL